MSGVPKLPLKARLERQSQYLEKARTIDSTCLAVRANTVRHHLIMAANGLGQDSQYAQELVDRLEVQYGKNPSVARLISNWDDAKSPNYRSERYRAHTAKVTSLREEDETLPGTYAKSHANDFHTFFIKPTLAP
jgi:hypothetical protein